MSGGDVLMSRGPTVRPTVCDCAGGLLCIINLNQNWIKSNDLETGSAGVCLISAPCFFPCDINNIEILLICILFWDFRVQCEVAVRTNPHPPVVVPDAPGDNPTRAPTISPNSAPPSATMSGGSAIEIRLE